MVSMGMQKLAGENLKLVLGHFNDVHVFLSIWTQAHIYSCII
jgi:hypothetical protein